MATRTKRKALGSVPEALAERGPRPYPLTEEAAERLKRVFTYHAPKGDQADRYERLRSLFRELAYAVVEMTPPGREQAVAMTNLETSAMWANAAIARGES